MAESGRPVNRPFGWLLSVTHLMYRIRSARSAAPRRSPIEAGRSGRHAPGVNRIRRDSSYRLDLNQLVTIAKGDNARGVLGESCSQSRHGQPGGRHAAQTRADRDRLNFPVRAGRPVGQRHTGALAKVPPASPGD